MANVPAGFDSLYKLDSSRAGHLLSSIGPAAKPASWGERHLGIGTRAIVL